MKKSFLVLACIMAALISCKSDKSSDVTADMTKHFVFMHPGGEPGSRSIQSLSKDKVLAFKIQRSCKKGMKTIFDHSSPISDADYKTIMKKYDELNCDRLTKVDLQASCFVQGMDNACSTFACHTGDGNTKSFKFVSWCLPAIKALSEMSDCVAMNALQKTASELNALMNTVGAKYFENTGKALDVNCDD